MTIKEEKGIQNNWIRISFIENIGYHKFYWLWLNKLNFSFLGYALFLNQMNTTCTNDGSNQISRAKPVNLSTCGSVCNRNENCTFFFVNDASWCILYRSCENYRVPKFTGSTYKKEKGNVPTWILYWSTFEN